MITPRWRKVLSDLWSNKARTLLVVLSIAVGVFAIGGLATNYLILNEDFPAAYQAIQPHSAFIYAYPLDDDLIESIRRIPGVAAAEGRTSVSGQVTVLGGRKVPIDITSIPQISGIQVDQVKLEQGDARLGLKDIYVERSAFAALGKKVGETLMIETSDGRLHPARLAGVVHDMNGNPFGMTGMVSAYSTVDTVEWLGGSRVYVQLLFRVAEKQMDEEHIRAVAKLIEDKIRRNGGEVYITVVYEPGKHPAQSTLDAVMALMGGMSVLTLFLSTFLVVNTINALLNQQVRQIGMMKAVGATIGQVMGMYLVLVLSFGVIALLISIPVAGVLGNLAALGIAQLLNMDLLGFRIPTGALWVMIIVGLGVPLIAGLWPVWSGARMTVREAMSNYGLSTLGKRSAFDRLLETIRGLPRPLLLSIRNTFRRKGRLLLTLITLVLGGSIFMGVFNVRESLYAEIEQTFNYILADLNVDFDRAYRMDRIQDAIGDVEGVEVIEGWGMINGQVMRSDGWTGDDIAIFAPPANSQLIKPVITEGRWLLPEDENAIVIGNHFTKIRPDVRVGDMIMVRLNGKKFEFQVVGIYRMAGNVIPPLLYANYEYVSRLFNMPGQVYSLRIVTDRHDSIRQNEVLKALEARFTDLGFGVGSMSTSSETITQQNMVIDILIYLLLFMAVLIAIVGGLGLMGTMSMNVLERTREIGVMRSIGAENPEIMQLVVVEGMVIGVISWGLGLLLSIPISQALNNLVGVTLLNVPMVYRFSMGGVLIWLVVVLVLSAIACIMPARNAVRLTVRDVLAYE